MLTVLFHKFRCKTAFQRNLLHQFLVIEGDTQRFSNHASDGAATAAKFTADGNDLLVHRDTSLGNELR